MIGLGGFVSRWVMPPQTRNSAANEFLKFTQLDQLVVPTEFSAILTFLMSTDWATFIALAVLTIFWFQAVVSLWAAIRGGSTARKLGFEGWGHAAFISFSSIIGAPITALFTYSILTYLGLGPAPK